LSTFCHILAPCGDLAAPHENGEHEHSDERRAEKIIIILNSVLPAKFGACAKKSAEKRGWEI